MNNKMNKIAIVIPGIKKTGGPESLHNLAYTLQRKFNIDCRIITYGDTKKNLNYFLKYSPNYIHPNDKWIKNSFLIFPEVSTALLENYKFNEKAIWWLSYINHFNSLKFKYKFKNYGIKGIFIKDQLRKKNDVLHFFQTESSKFYINTKYKINKNNLLKLESPLNTNFYKNAKELTLKRDNSIVLNPAKLSKKSLSLAKDFFNNFGYKVTILNSKTREEVIDILSKSKFYLDFGPHPGQERLPRESIMLGCYPIVGFRGTATNYYDLSIPFKYKIECSNNLEKKHLYKALHIASEINDGNNIEYFNYRERTEKQPERFNSQLEYIVKKIGKI